MLVGGEGATPTEKDLLALAASVDLKRPRALLEEVRAAVNDFARHADEAGVPRQVRGKIGKVLGAPGPAPSRRAPRTDSG